MSRRVLGLLILLSGCGPAVDERLAPGPAAHSRFHRFRVEAISVPAEIRHDLTLQEIGRLPGAAGSGLKTQGLSTIKHSLATHTRFSTATGTKAVYAWFDDVILEVAISSVIINIPKEYAPGSCEYEIVLEHERGQIGRASCRERV